MDGSDAIRAVLALALMTALALLVFAIWPGIDLAVSRRYYDTAVAAFPVDNLFWPELLRIVVWKLSEAMILLALVGLILSRGLRHPLLRLPTRDWAFVVLLYALAPGLLVDGLLKRYWGRARPANITEFGGTQSFTPPYRIADQCHRNCSFAAGEVAGAVALSLALLLILWHWRDSLGKAGFRAAAALAFCLPLFTGWQRIASGRHFLSDVVFSALFVLLIAAALSPMLSRRG